MILNDSFDYSIKNVLNEPKESNPNPFEKQKKRSNNHNNLQCLFANNSMIIGVDVISKLE